MAQDPKGDSVARRRFLVRWLAVLLLATGLAAGLARTEWGRSIEDIYYDYWHV